MTNQKIRVPRQKRAIEKKQNIIKTSYKLFCEKGYYKTNTAEIAQEAGVSTGIVYSYFSDKKDILLEVIKFYISSLSEQFQPLLSAPISADNLPSRIEQFIDIFVASHSMNIEAHNEFLALSLLENDINELFINFEQELISRLFEIFVLSGVSKTNLLEKVRIIYFMTEQICHDYIQRKQTKEEFANIKLIVVRTISILLWEKKLNTDIN